MDQLLDSIRSFGQAVDAAKTIADPREQASQIRDALQRLSAASRAGYGAGCVSAIAIDPKTLTFAEQTPERSIHIGNGGNNDLTFALDGLPEAFLAQPLTGAVPRGAQPVTVSIYRTVLPVDTAHPVTFRVRSNFEEELTIQIVLNGSAPRSTKSWARRPRRERRITNRRWMTRSPSSSHCCRRIQPTGPLSSTSWP